jgi:hypothetical protein
MTVAGPLWTLDLLLLLLQVSKLVSWSGISLTLDARFLFLLKFVDVDVECSCFVYYVC